MQNRQATPDKATYKPTARGNYHRFTCSARVLGKFDHWLLEGAGPRGSDREAVQEGDYRTLCLALQVLVIAAFITPSDERYAIRSP
jgi:hypothetical protein